MSKQSRKQRRESRESSSKSQHRQVKGKLLPPLLADISGWSFVNWERDTLPDALWVCSVLTSLSQLEAMHCIKDVLDRIQDLYDARYPENASQVDHGTIFDGTLTGLESVPHDIRDVVLQALSSDGLYEVAFSEEFIHSLGMYIGAPGRWLIQPSIDAGMSVDWETAQDHLGRVITLAAHGQSQIATDAKYMILRAYYRAGKIHYAAPAMEQVELLIHYPNGLSDEQLSRARPSIRATFNVVVGRSDNESTPLRIEWAKSFWRKNWQIYPCFPIDRLVAAYDLDSMDTVNSNDKEERVERYLDRFLRVSKWSDPDLYAPDRYEVLTGIVARCFRLTNALVKSPVLLSPEVGTAIVRILVDSEITLTWLISHNREENYERFKKHGRGQLKPFLLNLEEYSGSQAEENPRLEELIEDIRKEVNQDGWEEFLEIELGANFNKLSTREMAKQVGMEDQYRLQFSPASGAVHGEWTHLDRYALTRCANPLHRWHRIPTDDLTLLESPGVVDTALGILESVLRKYERTMGTGNSEH